jgi:hypothetical protein
VQQLILPLVLTSEIAKHLAVNNTYDELPKTTVIVMNNIIGSGSKFASKNERLLSIFTVSMATWEQQQQLYGHTGLVGTSLVRFVGLIDSVGLVDLINFDGLIGLVVINGCVGIIGIVDIVGLLIGPLIGLVDFIGLNVSSASWASSTAMALPASLALLASLASLA